MEAVRGSEYMYMYCLLVYVAMNKLWAFAYMYFGLYSDACTVMQYMIVFLFAPCSGFQKFQTIHGFSNLIEY